MKTRKRRLAWLILGLGTAFLLIFCSFYIPVSKRKLNPRPVISLLITDRDGAFLREVLSDEGGRCRWVSLKEISPVLLKATIAAEDRHFFAHAGINPYAVARAFLQNLRNRKVVSGASTITQQVVRNVYRFRRNLFSKIVEAWLAVRLEHSLSKGEILVQYLNRISYGNQAYGIEAASRLYLDKPSSDLSLAEAAFLATLPRSPSRLNPYRNFAAVEMRQKELLHRMAGLGSITKSESQRAIEEKIRLRPAHEKFRAPHFCDYVLAQVPVEKISGLSTIRTSLDYSLQEKIETLLRNHLRFLEKKGITNGAVLVLDNATGDILAMAGSKDFFDERNDGQVNGSLALRQPGSTLKPLTYALALEKGMTAATIIEDVPSQFPAFEGNFAPENYDEKYHGPIRLRSALASSYNIPAVSVLQRLGPDLLYRRLKDLEFASLEQTPEFYGGGLTLGNGEVTLLELTRAYACLARKGLSLRERSILEYGRKEGGAYSPTQGQDGRRIFSPEVSYIITDILADHDARVPTFGYLSPLNFHFPVAAKTGTSKDFRDNWTLGYTPAVTIGVWVGNFDGTPMHNVSGMTGAGPLFRDVMLLVSSRNKTEEFPEPTNLVHCQICPLSGKLPSTGCPGTIDEIFLPGTEPRVPCRLNHQKGIVAAAALPAGSGSPSSGVAIVVPQEGDIFKMDPVLRKSYQSILLKASVPEAPGIAIVEWRVNGRKIGDCRYPYSLAWNLSPGSYTIRARAVGKAGAMDSRPVKILVIS